MYAGRIWPASPAGSLTQRLEDAIEDALDTKDMRRASGILGCYVGFNDVSALACFNISERVADEIQLLFSDLLGPLPMVSRQPSFSQSINQWLPGNKWTLIYLEKDNPASSQPSP
jgi:hypothetical protein